MPRYDFRIGAPVHCRDGTCGKLHKVVVDPHTERVTDLIVARGFLLTTDRVLPVDIVERATEEGIYLSIASDQIGDYPQYREVAFNEPAPGVKVGGYDGRDVRRWVQGYRTACREPIMPMVRRQLHTGISPEGTVIERGTAVKNAQGTIGHVDHLLVDRESAEVSQMVVRKGLLPYYPVVPITSVVAVTREGVRVSLSDQEVDGLPRYRSRDAEDIEAELRHRLEASPLELSQIELSTEGGIVTLVGWVPDVGAKRRAEAIARSVEGVIDVQNGLDTEVTIATRVLSALLSDPRTRLSAIDIVNERGVVTLEGNVDSVEIRDAAAEITEEQAGVLSVVNGLEVTPDGDTEPLRAGWLSVMMLAKKTQ